MRPPRLSLLAVAMTFPLLPFDYIFDLTFTPDSRHVVYAGVNEIDQLSWDFYMVLDGKRVLSNLAEFQELEIKECGNSVLADQGLRLLGFHACHHEVKPDQRRRA